MHHLTILSKEDTPRDEYEAREMKKWPYCELVGTLVWISLISWPDISFITKQRLKSLGFKRSTRTFFPGAPNLAVEILSLNNTRRDIDERLKDFFESGMQVAWIIDPRLERVEICHSLTKRQLIGSGGFLKGETLLPGFRYPIADLFKEWDWE